MDYANMLNLERKFCGSEGSVTIDESLSIEGYASLFGHTDRGGDVVEKGAYAGSLSKLKAARRGVRMLWQHDPNAPIGIWDEVYEDDKGLYVKGRLAGEVRQAREAASLLALGAIEGLSIGYRTIRAAKDGSGLRRLKELELWEVSLVTFPMLPEARVGAKGDSPDDGLMRDLASAFEAARRSFAKGTL